VAGRIGHGSLQLALILGAVVMVLPLVWIVSASLQPRADIFDVPFRWIPARLELENYTEAFAAAPFGTYFLNSLLIAGLATVIHLAVTSLAAFGLAHYRFPGRRALFVAILSTMMIPFQVVMIPLYLQVRDLGWLDSYEGVIVPTAVTALGVFLMRQFMLTIPRDYFDAARIDGASDLQLFYRIALPLSKPAFAALGIFVFLEQWNSLIWPLIVVTDVELRPLSVGLTEFQTQYGTDYGYLLAASVASVIPVVVLFLLLRRQFVRGVTIGTSKG
jgi:ABC-type glycerol-3-phosphate transport system permease component